MQSTSYSLPFAVRFIGFSTEEEQAFDLTFSVAGGTYSYFRLTEGNLQDPDLFIVNAEQPEAIAALDAFRPTPVRPALLIGRPPGPTPLPYVERPIVWSELAAALDELVERRAAAMARLRASDVVVVPERRRRLRPFPRSQNPDIYRNLRRPPPRKGMVLVVDDSPLLSDYLSGMLRASNTPVVRFSNEADIIMCCRENEVALIIINTASLGSRAYELCQAVKEQSKVEAPSVIFLTSKPFIYDADLASRVGADGYLSQPISSPLLKSALMKFLPNLH